MESPVLAAVDGSPQSVKAAMWAADEAVRRGTSLRLLHAGLWLDRFVDPDYGDVRGAALQMLDQVQEEIHSSHPRLGVDVVLIHDDSIEGLVAAASGGRLLVLGSRGLGGFVGALVGSVGLAVCGRTGTPAVLVRAGQSTDEVPGQEVVVGVDPRAMSDPVVGFAFEEAGLRGAAVRAVHGWNLPPVGSSLGWILPPPGLSADVEKAEAERLARVLGPWRDKYPETRVVEEVRFGGGARALVEVSDRAGLVVVGRRLRRSRVGWHLGPVAHAVLHHAKAPVAIVPHA
jgi:nucleotide-binding universal stress UspA family protein